MAYAGARFWDQYFRGLRELLLEWSELRLDPIEIADRETGEKFKQVWRGIARRLVQLLCNSDHGWWSENTARSADKKSGRWTMGTCNAASAGAGPALDGGVGVSGSGQPAGRCP